jgi:hypothetical protein
MGQCLSKVSGLLSWAYLVVSFSAIKYVSGMNVVDGEAVPLYMA